MEILIRSDTTAEGEMLKRRQLNHHKGKAGVLILAIVFFVCRGNRANPEYERQLRIRCLVFHCQQLHAASHHRDNVRAKVDTDGNQRTKMHGNIEREALIAPSKYRRHEHEMPGAGNGQELGQPLHDGEYDDLQPAHGELRRAVPGVIKCASCL